MKRFAQTFLIAGGILGFITSTPIAAYGWIMHRGFGGDLTNRDRVILYAPLACASSSVIGICWRRLAKKEESI